MNYWRSGIVFGTILFICSFTGLYNTTPLFSSNGKDLIPSGVYDLSGSVIYIDDISEYYTWESFSQLNPLCTGKGIVEDPYIIQGSFFSSETSDTIVIMNSKAHFMIKDSIIYNSGRSGIVFKNVQNGNINDSSIVNSDDNGIFLDSSSNVTIANNEVLRNKQSGINIFRSSNIIIKNNRVTNNRMGGISLFKGDSTTVDSNTVSSNNLFGVVSGMGNGHIIKNNNIFNHSNGIYLYKSIFSSVAGNEITNSTEFGIITLYNSNFNTIINNTLLNNYFFIGLGEDCVNNNISNNSVNQVLIIDRIYGPPPFSEEELEELNRLYFSYIYR